MAAAPIAIQIPATNQPEGKLDITLPVDGRIFVVGPNGSGKSALIHYFVAHIGDHPLRRISAHRQTWLNSSTIELTPKARRDAKTQFERGDRQQSSRWKDDAAAQRLMAVLFDLVAVENQRAREITDLMDSGQEKEAKAKASSSESSFKRINDLLRAGNMTVQIEAVTGEEILAHHVGGEPFSMAQLSDGERNAIILGATVLTVEPGTLLLIDEPERHLHRSIMEPFLTALFASRDDCPFIVSTHELSLPLAAPDAKVLLPRSCKWKSETPVSWDIDVLRAGSTLPADLKQSVLGSRKIILFVEGEIESLDAPIYGLLLPDTTVVPKGSCNNVIRAVEGLHAAEDLHWVSSYGLIDRDDRTDDEIKALQDRSIYALTVHSAEAIYFSNQAMRRLANRQAETLGRKPDELLNAAIKSALEILADEETMLRLCARRCERSIQGKILSQLPNWRDIQACDYLNFNVPVKPPYEQEIENYREAHRGDNLAQLISRYPVRETSALNEIAIKLEFKGTAKYEQAVLAMAVANAEFREELRAFVKPLADAINR